MKYSIVLFLFFISIGSLAQNRNLILEKMNSENSVIIKENKRIKLETKDGQKHYGRFTIIDSSSILLQENIILLADIEKIRKKSLFATFANPVFVGVGFIFITGGIAGALTGGYGYIATIGLLPPGIALTLIALITNKHPADKWTYKIQIE